MTTIDRKAAIAAYKERKVAAGIYAVRCAATGEVWVEQSRHVETQRNGLWFAASQDVSPKDNVSVGWAHAGRTPGDPGGQHNYNPTDRDDAANMYTVAWRHAIDKSLTFYVDYAMTNNHPDAHYDLGAGGHGVTTDCHDSTPLAAFDPTTGGVSNSGPHCFAGGKLQGVSVGAAYKF